MRITRGKASLGREEITLEVRIWCWVYLYNSGGRRSEADRTRYEQKKRKNETHTTVRSRTAVVHNIRGKAYPNMTASIAQRQQSGWLEAVSYTHLTLPTILLV